MSCALVPASIAVASVLLSAVAITAQESATDQAPAIAAIEADAISVPRLIRYVGSVSDSSGKPLSGMVEIHFALYQNQQDSYPTWQETQSLSLDAQGRYSVLLGVTEPDGLPLSLFNTSMSHWLSIDVPGAATQPRVLLAAVPYALKAVDADTLGGMPASAFMRLQTPDHPTQDTPAAASIPRLGASQTARTTPNATPAASITGTGTSGYLPVWTSGSNLGNSSLFQLSGSIGLGTTTPGARLDSLSTSIALRGTSSGTTGIGVFGNASSKTGSTTGVFGETSSTTANAAGVSGEAIGTSGATIGVWGRSLSTSGVGVAGVSPLYGVTGNATAANGTGVLGVSPLYGVTGFSTTTSSSNSIGVWGRSASTYGTGVAGSAPEYGVIGSAGNDLPNTAGVLGQATAITGVNTVYGVQGSAKSYAKGSSGVNGTALATTGQVYGVSGYTNSSTTNAAGVMGYTNATQGQIFGVSGGSNSVTTGAAGVNGYEGAATGQVYGVSGATKSASQLSAGVYGNEGSTSGQVYGVFGSTNSSTGGAAAVDGYEGATTGSVAGVAGGTNSVEGEGVYGAANATTGNAIGVVGVTSSSGGSGGAFVNLSGSGLVLTGIAGKSYETVFSVDSSGDGIFTGNLKVTGTIIKGGGSFKIDHPLDPANKYLSHSFVESPDMMNVYNGVIRLDAAGQAWVNLPQYFEALNRDFRYQLTPIGAPAPNLHIAKEVSGNRFKIAGGKPGGKVSWQVTGIRQDAYANANRITVEETKPPSDQGFYLHPELYGQPESRAVGSRQNLVQRQGSASLGREAAEVASPTVGTRAPR